MVLFKELSLHPTPAGFDVVGVVETFIVSPRYMEVIIPELGIDMAAVRVHPNTSRYLLINELLDEFALVFVWYYPSSQLASPPAGDTCHTDLVHDFVRFAAVVVIGLLLILAKVGFVYLDMIFCRKFEGFDDMQAKQTKVLPDCWD